MESHSLASIICVALCISVTTLAEANQYYVGGSKDIGWNDKPKKFSYNHWSKKTRFNVDDTIIFTYPYGKDKVLYVREEDYKKCDNKNPVKTWDEGYTEVALFRTGIYHFIGGNDGSCQKGQRLIVFVPEVQSRPELTPATAPTPPLSPPSVPSSTPPPTQTPPSPAAHTPAAAPSPLSPPVPSTPQPPPHIPAAAPSPLSPPAQAPPSPAPHTPAAAPSPLSLPTQTPPSPAPHTPAAAPSPLISPPPTQKSPSQAPSISKTPESSPPPAPPTPTAEAPSYPAPQPSVYAPAPAPSSALPIATRSILAPLVGLLFGVLFY